MTEKEIQELLSCFICRDLLIEAGSRGVQPHDIFVPRLVRAMTQFSPRLLIQEVWQLTAFKSLDLEQDMAPMDSEQTDSWGNSLIHYLVWSGNGAKVSRIYDDKQIKKVNHHGMNIVHFAAWSGCVNQLKWASRKIREGLKLQDKEGRMAVHYAAWSGCHDTLKLVLDEDSRFCTVESFGHETAVHYAAWSGNRDTLALVLATDTSALTRKDGLGRKAVHYAAWSGDANTLALVFEKDHYAFIHKDREGRTAAHYAAWSSDLETLKLVLAKDPEALTCKDEQGRTVAHYAAWSGNPELLDLLLTKALDQDRSLQAEDEVDGLAREIFLSAKDKHGRTLAHFGAWSGNYRLLEWLLAQDKEALLQLDKYGNTPSYHAIESESLPLLDSIFEKNAEAFNAERVKIAYYAANSRNPALLAWVLERDQTALSHKMSRGARPATDEALDLSKEWLGGQTAGHDALNSKNPAMKQWIFTHQLEWVALNYVKNKRSKEEVAYFVIHLGNPKLINRVFSEIKLTELSDSFLRNKNGSDKSSADRIKIHQALLNALMTNFVIMQGNYPIWGEEDKKLRDPFISFLERNRILMESLNWIKAPTLFGAIGHTKEELALQKVMFERANALKQRGYLCPMTEQKMFLEEHLELTQTIWAKRLEITVNLEDSPSNFLKEYQGKRLSSKIGLASFFKFTEGSLLALIPRFFSKDTWQDIKIALDSAKSKGDVFPSKELDDLMAYVDYRAVIESAILALTPPQEGVAAARAP